MYHQFSTNTNITFQVLWKKWKGVPRFVSEKLSYIIVYGLGFKVDKKKPYQNSPPLHQINNNLPISIHPIITLFICLFITHNFGNYTFVETAVTSIEDEWKWQIDWEICEFRAKCYLWLTNSLKSVELSVNRNPIKWK